jgi:hypothetical protein
MKNILIILALALVAVSCNSGPKKPASVSLFNGTDLTGWHWDVPAMDTDPEMRNPFIVRDGLLVSLGTPGGHLITDAEYQNYRLEVEYRFAGRTRKLRCSGTCFNTPRALQYVPPIY